LRRACLAPLLLAAPLAAAGELQDDLKARRARVMEAIGPESVLVHWSAPVKVYSNTVDYEYRQDSDMLYLTGVEQDGTTLVLLPGNKTKKSILFVSDADPRREHREGHLLSKREAQDASGVDEVRFVSGFDSF
jgi:Xaa-Pro aminopeptidase